jgi:hypothetical protein
MKLNGRISNIILSVLIIGAVGMILYTIRTPKASVKEMPALITNETENLQVVSSTIEASRLYLVIKNTGKQPIIGYHFDWKAKEGLSGDLTSTNALAPGSHLTIAIPLSQLNRDATTGSYKVNLAMAIFEDGSAEGDWTRAQEYRDKIAGATLAAPQIQAKVVRVNSLSISTIESLVSDLQTLTPPQNLGKWQTIGYEGAVIRARSQAAYILRQQQSPDKVEKGIIELRKSAERQAALGRSIVEGRQIQ